MSSKNDKFFPCMMRVLHDGGHVFFFTERDEVKKMLAFGDNKNRESVRRRALRNPEYNTFIIRLPETQKGDVGAVTDAIFNLSKTIVLEAVKPAPKESGVTITIYVPEASAEQVDFATIEVALDAIKLKFELIENVGVA